MLDVAHFFRELNKSPKVSLVSKVARLIHGLWVVLATLLFHSNLFEVAGFYILSSPSKPKLKTVGTGISEFRFTQ
jgi:hypothetical protein